MEADESRADPFSRLLHTLAVIEHPVRGLTLLAVYLAQLSDDNSVARILMLYNRLSGEETTSGRLRRNLTALYNAGLIEREEEKMLGTVKVSFHRILPLGEIAIFYFFSIFILNDLYTDLNVDIFTFKETMAKHDTLELTKLFLRDCLEANIILKKYSYACRENKNLERMKLNPVNVSIGPVLGGKKGFVFRIFEELLSDYLQASTGKTKQELSESLEQNVTPSAIRSFGSLVMTGNLGRTTYYRLDRKGVSILPILLMLIRQLSADPEVIKARKLFFYPKTMDNPWIVLTRNAKSIFHMIYLSK